MALPHDDYAAGTAAGIATSLSAAPDDADGAYAHGGRGSMLKRGPLMAAVAVFVYAIALLMASGGCSGKVSLRPNADPALRKTPAQFAADAARRVYPSDLPSGGQAKGRAHVGYVMDSIEIVNFSEQDWTDVEVWVNRRYVVFVPTIEAGEKVKTITFRMLYDADGNAFPTDNAQTQVNSVDLVMDGMVYELPCKQAD